MQNLINNMIKKILILVPCSLIIVSCDQDSNLKEKLLDMTYPFDENSIYWPNANPFKLTKGNWGKTDLGLKC